MNNFLTQRERERERVPIKDSTKKGYSYAEDGDGIDLGLNRANHRGTVKKQISHTIKTEVDCGVIEIENIHTKVVAMLDEPGRLESACRVHDPNYISPCVNTMGGGGREPKIMENVKIRKLTPKECIRLMGFDDSDYSAMAEVNSDTQIYKQAGNSIVVNVLEAIFKEML